MMSTPIYLLLISGINSYLIPVNAQDETRVQLSYLSPIYARLPAYYSKRSENYSYAKIAWDNLLSLNSERMNSLFEIEFNKNNNILQAIFEVKNISTHHTAQWCLNTIELLELIGDLFQRIIPVFQMIMNK